MHNFKEKLTAFTLVELIVVITILAILATIGFVSFQGYGVTSRDAVRLADMRSIEKGISIKLTKGEQLPIPDDKIDITASGTLLTYQGYAGSTTVGKLGVHGEVKDPIDNTYYTYSTNTRRNKYQLLGFFESEDNISFNNNTYADLSGRYPQLKGDKLGIILDSITKEPIQEESSNVDIVNTTDNYSLYLGNEIDQNISGNGLDIFSSLYNNRIDVFENKYFAQYDESLIGYWDMETLNNSGSIDYISDLSGNNNHGKCYNYNTILNCGGEQGAQKINGVKGDGLYFDGINDYFEVTELFNENFPNIGTLNFFIKSNLSTQNGRSIFDYYNSTRNHIFLRSYTGSYSMQLAYQSDPDNKYIFVKNETPSEDNFNFISFSWNTEEKSSKYYINGLLVGEKIYPENWVLDGQYFRFFGFPDGFATLNGILDEIRLYNKVLSDDEINNIYNFYTQ